MVEEQCRLLLFHCTLFSKQKRRLFNLTGRFHFSEKKWFIEIIKAIVRLGDFFHPVFVNLGVTMQVRIWKSINWCELFQIVFCFV